MCTIGPSIKFTLCRQYTWLAVLIAPLLALFDTASFYINHPSLMRYWYALAGVAIGRLAWYVGLMFGPPHMIDSAGSNSQ